MSILLWLNERRNEEMKRGILSIKRARKKIRIRNEIYNTKMLTELTNLREGFFEFS